MVVTLATHLFTVDFLWRNEQVLLTCSKDGKVIQQLFSNAQRPAERAVRTAVQTMYIFFIALVAHLAATEYAPRNSVRQVPHGCLSIQCHLCRGL